MPRKPLGFTQIPASWDEMTQAEQLAWCEKVAAQMKARIADSKQSSST
jgi:hypothetical protein